MLERASSFANWSKIWNLISLEYKVNFVTPMLNTRCDIARSDENCVNDLLIPGDYICYYIGFGLEPSLRGEWINYIAEWFLNQSFTVQLPLIFRSKLIDPSRDSGLHTFNWLRL